ncbi:MAG: hypothetical protein U9O94_10135, partial [Nanoarchaeota archaeon]|nr:hypothetical protein [Nanoarchaeota archaeon]
MKEKVISWTIKGFLLLLMVILSTSFLFAEPSGPAVINVSAPETRGTTAAMEVKAQAGNITALSIDATTVTKSWQGYYGNISGSVTLDDNVNYTMYSWSAVTPEGEVYASNASSVTWSNIKCINFTGNMSENQINVTVLEDMFGMGAADSDGVNETFSTLYVDSNGF